jgi:tetratricopeptide (TPR) repeat protein
MKRYRSGVWLLLLSLVFVGVSLGQKSKEVTALITEGDKYSTEAFDNQKALDSFLKAAKLAPADDDVLWRISRSYVDIGEHMPSATKEEKEKQLEFYQKSLDYAEQAVKANPSNAMAYTRRAIANGRVALFMGIWNSISLVKQVKADCEKAIQMNPSEPAAYYVLARTHAKLCEKPKMIRWPLGLSWANLDEAVQYYEKSISLRPSFIMYRLDAARTYIEREEFAKAKDQLTKIQSLPTEDEDDNQFRKEAKELYEKIKNE